ncbi:maleylpyruvate isomerase family mycothiol-dependent enzyme [Nocardia lijiangensis]|uniref:maleylpyruvate isomerase family mycothiol-dependent enzyme n=1 Tax=Nocardia lijiangensis TaxID=299618 RepID=UPI0008376EE4|nr:maleylpyruvate isomerase family mycothiol-dependent enzyme [Nocardia lijiangensis]
MDRDLILTWVRAERLALADFLDNLTETEWAQDSLCSSWTVHDVLAHITVRDTVWTALVGMIRARGNWDRMTAELAREHAARFTPTQLIAQLREAAGSAHRAPGAGPVDPLVDIIVHGQDIARPLGRSWQTPAERVVVALDHVLTSRFYGARKGFRGARLTATDTEWTYGDGLEEINGSAIDLLLLATGRQDSRTQPPLTHPVPSRFTDNRRQT